MRNVFDLTKAGVKKVHFLISVWKLVKRERWIWSVLSNAVLKLSEVTLKYIFSEEIYICILISPSHNLSVRAYKNLEILPRSFNSLEEANGASYEATDGQIVKKNVRSEDTWKVSTLYAYDNDE